MIWPPWREGSLSLFDLSQKHRKRNSNMMLTWIRRGWGKITVLTSRAKFSTIWPCFKKNSRSNLFATAVVFGGRVSLPTAKVNGGRTWLRRHIHSMWKIPYRQGFWRYACTLRARQRQKQKWARSSKLARTLPSLSTRIDAWMHVVCQAATKTLS